MKNKNIEIPLYSKSDFKNRIDHYTTFTSSWCPPGSPVERKPLATAAAASKAGDSTERDRECPTCSECPQKILARCARRRVWAAAARKKCTVGGKEARVRGGGGGRGAAFFAKANFPTNISEGRRSSEGGRNEGRVH